VRRSVLGIVLLVEATMLAFSALGLLAAGILIDHTFGRTFGFSVAWWIITALIICLALIPALFIAAFVLIGSSGEGNRSLRASLIVAAAYQLLVVLWLWGSTSGTAVSFGQSVGTAVGSAILLLLSGALLYEWRRMSSGSHVMAKSI
jgi:hypothetical protein